MSRISEDIDFGIEIWNVSRPGSRMGLKQEFGGKIHMLELKSLKLLVWTWLSVLWIQAQTTEMEKVLCPTHGKAISFVTRANN